MHKDNFEEIEVPSFEAKHAIKRGIQKGVQEQKKMKNRTRNKIIKILLPIVAVITLTFSLGFVSEPIAQAVSKIPIIGETIDGFYEAYADERDGGNEDVEGNNDRLPDPDQITETSLVATDQGITVEITGTYNYQNGTMGVFFEATGDINNEEEMFVSGGPDNAYSYYLFDQIPDFQQGGYAEFGYSTHVDGFEKVGDAYVGNLVIDFEDNDYPDTLDTIPLTFTSMCAKEGEWSFEIPVIDDPNTVALDIEQSGHGLTIHYDSIYLGESTSSLYYTLTTDASFNGNDIDDGTSTMDFRVPESDVQLTFVDDKGEEIPVSSIDAPSAGGGTDGSCTFTCEITFASPIPADCEYLTVYVEAVNHAGETVTLDPVKLDLKQ